MCHYPDGSLATLKRFGVRLVAVAFFAALWPHRSIDEAVAILSLIMAAVCALAVAAGPRAAAAPGADPLGRGSSAPCRSFTFSPLFLTGSFVAAE